MRITAVGMVKNEADIIHLFAGHLAALCDSIVLVDNRSDDGTAEFLADLAAADDRFGIYRFVEPGYEQSLLMSTIAHEVPAAVEADWLLALDADELVAVTSREELVHRLDEHADALCATLQWRNVVPVSFDSDVFDLDRKVWIPEITARHCGLAVNRARLRDDTTFAIGQGNHALLSRPGGRPLPAGVGPDLFHVPIRSEHQIVCKAAQGVQAYAGNAGVRDARQGSHWQRFLDAYQRGEVSHAELAGFAAEYGMVGDDELPSLDPSHMAETGYVQATLDVAFDDSTLPPSPHFDGVAAALRLAAGTAESSTEPPAPLRRLAIVDHDILRAPGDRGVRFHPLARRPAPETLDHERLLSSFLEPHVWPICSIVPTSWGGHIPFLFCLFNAHRPRRFVELGTHHGASFFAACQAATQLGLDTECVAIDTWEGDHQAGLYGEKVKRRFLDELDRRGYSQAVPLQALFDDAADEFDQGSIDLLHIDGLHTYDAVANDFHTWLPKLTDDAVVIFHDTMVFERDFGVWRFFGEVSDQYLTFNFRHTHGLGVLVNHGAVDHPIGRLVQLLAGDATEAEFTEALFASAGERAVAAARLGALEADMGENPRTVVRDLAKQRAQLAKARLKIQKQQREIDALTAAERLARSDLRWLIGRLDGSPARPLLRRYAGFEKLRKRWLGR